MKLRLSSRGAELPAEFRQYVQRRVRFSLGRFAPRIRSVSIRLTDVNGPRDGVDKCCQIRVNCGLQQEVIVHERQANIYAAAAIATERARVVWCGNSDCGRRRRDRRQAFDEHISGGRKLRIEI